MIVYEFDEELLLGVIRGVADQGVAEDRDVALSFVKDLAELLGISFGDEPNGLYLFEFFFREVHVQSGGLVVFISSIAYLCRALSFLNSRFRISFGFFPS